MMDSENDDDNDTTVHIMKIVHHGIIEVPF